MEPQAVRIGEKGAEGEELDQGGAAGGEASGEERGAGGAEESGDDGYGGTAQEGAYRKRGRPRKYEGLDEAERRKRRMADNRQSAKRSYYRKVNRMKELEEENSSLRSELGAELAKLAEIDTGTQERMLSVTQRMGGGLLDPELLAKYARKQDLSLPLFQHAAKLVAQAAGPRDTQQPPADEEERARQNSADAQLPTVVSTLHPDTAHMAAVGTTAPGADQSLGAVVEHERARQVYPPGWVAGIGAGAAGGIDLGPKSTTNAVIPAVSERAPATRTGPATVAGETADGTSVEVDHGESVSNSARDTGLTSADGMQSATGAPAEAVSTTTAAIAATIAGP